MVWMKAIKGQSLMPERCTYFDVQETLSVLFPPPVNRRAFIEALDWLELEIGVWSCPLRLSYLYEDCSLSEAFCKCKDWPREDLEHINAQLWISAHWVEEEVETLFRQAVQYRWLLEHPDKRDVDFDMREGRVWAGGKVPGPDQWPTIPTHVYAALCHKGKKG